jgi:hypothetical protein
MAVTGSSDDLSWFEENLEQNGIPRGTMAARIPQLCGVPGVGSPNTLRKLIKDGEIDAFRDFPGGPQKVIIPSYRNYLRRRLKEAKTAA